MVTFGPEMFGKYTGDEAILERSAAHRSKSAMNVQTHRSENTHEETPFGFWFVLDDEDQQMNEVGNWLFQNDHQHSTLLGALAP
jgi:hypothetical protein